MVDYSKWSQMDYGSSDEDTGPSVVTTLDQPSRVTFGGGKVTIASQSHDTGPNVATPLDIVSPVAMPSENVVERVNDISVDSNQQLFLWKQNATNVEIFIPVSSVTRAKDVLVELQPSGFLKVSTKSKEGIYICMIDRRLYLDVYGAIHTVPMPISGISEKEAEDKEMEWELVLHGGQKTINITLTKFVPYADLIRTMWWKRAFQGGDEQDVDTKQLHRDPEGAERLRSILSETHDDFVQQHVNVDSESC